MDGLNLMEFESPVLQPKVSSPSAIDVSASPGNNPFDSLSKQAETVPKEICVTTQSDFQAYPYAIEDLFKININMPNSGKVSSPFLKDCDMSGRESLGILKFDALNLSFTSEKHAGSPLTSNIKDFQHSHCSPLNTAFLHPLSYCSRKQSVASSSSVSPNPSLFNSGSLEASEPSKIYSLNETRNFDLVSKSEDIFNDAAFMDTFSKSRPSDFSPNACIASSTSCCEPFGGILIKNVNTRLLSLPELDNEDTNMVRLFALSKSSKKTCLRSEPLWSTEVEIDDLCRDTSMKMSVAEANSIQQEMDDAFNDSVFIEAHHLVSKIEDGSILMNKSFAENLLDCTSPPDFEDIEENEVKDSKIDAETVFKVIDKMLPLQQKINNYEIKEDKENSGVHSVEENVSISQQSYNNSSKKAEEFKQNLKNIFNEKIENCSQKLSSSRSSSNGSAKSRDANELLQDLSEIINSGHRDSKQQIEGQQLLFSLADILCSDNSKILSNDKIDSLEDSGHSSIENEDQPLEQDLNNCYEVEDLRVASSKSNDNEQILDLSMKSKIQNASKRLSQSFCFANPKLPPTKLFDNLKVQKALKSSSLELIKDKSNSDIGRLKPKKPEQKGTATKKGPLKAIIPFGNIAKRGSFSKTPSATVTPPKIEHTQSSLFKVKRTSTPIVEPQLKPVAQSTPETVQPKFERNKPGSCSSQLKKRRFYCPVSPLAIPSNTSHTSSNSDLNKSGSAPNLLNRSANHKSLIPSPKPMYRRHSATELKINQNVPDNNAKKLKRSCSIGKDLKTSNMINKMKGSVSAALSTVKGTNSNLSKNLVLSCSQKNSILQERNPSIGSNIKTFSLLGKLKKSNTGKENAGH